MDTHIFWTEQLAFKGIQRRAGLRKSGKIALKITADKMIVILPGVQRLQHRGYTIFKRRLVIAVGQ